MACQRSLSALAEKFLDSKQTLAGFLNLPQFLYKQFRPCSKDGCTVVQVQMEGRALLQMDEEHLRIKEFYWTSENAVKIQIYLVDTSEATMLKNISNV